MSLDSLGSLDSPVYSSLVVSLDSPVYSSLVVSLDSPVYSSLMSHDSFITGKVKLPSIFIIMESFCTPGGGEVLPIFKSIHKAILKGTII
jgi:hypothetical protein